MHLCSQCTFFSSNCLCLIFHLWLSVCDYAIHQACLWSSSSIPLLFDHETHSVLSVRVKYWAAHPAVDHSVLGHVQKPQSVQIKKGIHYRRLLMLNKPNLSCLIYAVSESVWDSAQKFGTDQGQTDVLKKKFNWVKCLRLKPIWDIWCKIKL